MLLTGHASRFFEAELLGDGGVSSTVSDVPPWDAPTKIVARYLGPYLARGRPRRRPRPSAAAAADEPQRVRDGEVTPCGCAARRPAATTAR
jgi:hypothetical protein